MDGLTHGKGVHPNFQEPPIYDTTNSLYLNSIPSQSGEIFQDFPTYAYTARAEPTGLQWHPGDREWQLGSTVTLGFWS